MGNPVNSQAAGGVTQKQAAMSSSRKFVTPQKWVILGFVQQKSVSKWPFCENVVLKCLFLQKDLVKICPNLNFYARCPA